MKNLLVGRILLKVFTLALGLSTLLIARGQETDTHFYFGVDLSYVNEMEDCGAIYRENGEPRDLFALFAAHGASLVRARLWHNPEWTHYSTLEDVKQTFSRARDAGMFTMLDFQYSDKWADAGHQEPPAGWQDMDDEELVNAVYQYTYDVLMELHINNLAPAFVQIGNETNSGILKREGERDWSRDAALFNAGIRAVRDFTAETNTNPQILLHVAQPENTGWWFTQAEAAGITDFDMIGVSYYHPQWSTFSIADMGAHVSYLRQHFGKEIIVVETAYPWTRDAVDETADNILNEGIRGYPLSPEGQHRFMNDLTQSLISNGALGVVYWEPAWVSTECFTHWGQGSHWENATFFDFQNNNELLEGIDFLSDEYLYPDKLVDGVIEESYGDPLVEDSTSDVLDSNPALDLGNLYLRANEDMISLAITITGDVSTERGNYLIYFDTTQDAQGADSDAGRRPITVADPYKPEFRLDVSIMEERGTISGRYVLNMWAEDEWAQVTFTGGAAISSGQTSVIELQMSRALLGNPQLLNVAVLSTDRARVHTAGDILGSASVPADWSDELILDVFSRYALSD
jgi:arabinogalactan endo-1,4-beta-galactosidase